MAARINLDGTTISSFQIGVEGPTIYEGTSTPISSFGVDGDLFIKKSTPQRTYQKVSGKWIWLGARSWTVNGSLPVVRTNNSIDLELVYTTGVITFRPGQIVGLSILSTSARTAGTCLFQATKNDSIVGSGVTLDATHTLSNYIELSVPIVYNAGDKIGGRTTTTGFSPDKTDMTGTIYLEDT